MRAPGQLAGRSTVGFLAPRYVSATDGGRTMRLWRVLAGGVAVLLSVLAGGGVAGAIYDSQGALTVSKASLQRNEQVTVSGSGYAPASSIVTTLTSAPATLGTAQAGATGTFSATYAIPADTALGSHTITAAGKAPDGSSLTLTAAITVVTDSSAANLVGTGGAHTSELVNWAVVLVAVGCVLIVSTAHARYRAQLKAHRPA